MVLGYAMWVLIGGVLLLRSMGWRGRRLAYGTLVGVLLATAMLGLYMARPALDGRRATGLQSGGSRGASGRVFLYGAAAEGNGR